MGRISVCGPSLLVNTQMSLRDEPTHWRKPAEEARHAASQSQAVHAFAEKTLLESADAHEQWLRLAGTKSRLANIWAARN